MTEDRLELATRMLRTSQRGRATVVVRLRASQGSKPDAVVPAFAGAMNCSRPKPIGRTGRDDGTGDPPESGRRRVTKPPASESIQRSSSANG